MLSEYELTGAWNTLPSAKRTPLRLARLAEVDTSKLTYSESLELETARATGNSVEDQGSFGAGGGQGAFNYNVVPVQPGQQYNAFGAPLAGAAREAGGQVSVHDNHEDHMLLSEMAVVGAFFDKILKPGKQRKTWGYMDGPRGGGGDNDDDDFAPHFVSPPRGFGGRGGNGTRYESKSSSQTSQRAPKLKPSLFGPEINAFDPIVQQLRLLPAFYNNTNTNTQQPISPSALSTCHVSHDATNISDRASGGTTSLALSPSSSAQVAASTRPSFVRQQQQQAQAGEEVSMSCGPLAQPSGTAIPYQWKSAETAILDEYKHVTNNASPPV